MFQRFLSVADAERALHALRKLARHDVGRWALTGGFAIEIHHWCMGLESCVRCLNDIDFVTGSFDCIPETLADDFLFRHVHPLDAPGKTMLQFVDPESALRIDVFRACGATMDRVSRQDLHFLRLMELLAPADVETAWQDHRKPNHPVSFAEANSLLQDLIPAHPELLVTPDYSNDTEKVCARCKPISAFPLTDPSLVLSLLGYC